MNDNRRKVDPALPPTIATEEAERLRRENVQRGIAERERRKRLGPLRGDVKRK